MKKTPDIKTQMKAAMNIEIALSHMPGRAKTLSPKEERFRDALGVRLKTK